MFTPHRGCLTDEAKINILHQISINFVILCKRNWEELISMAKSQLHWDQTTAGGEVSQFLTWTVLKKNRYARTKRVNKESYTPLGSSFSTHLLCRSFKKKMKTEMFAFDKNPIEKLMWEVNW